MITFPASPAIGQEYVATNGATYIWLGNRWSAAETIRNGDAVFIYEGGDSTTWASADQTNAGDIILDGGTS